LIRKPSGMFEMMPGCMTVFDMAGDDARLVIVLIIV
jgi:hypothetical protein